MIKPLSPPHQRLICLLIEKGAIEQTVIRFLDVCDVPANNHGLRQQARRITEILGQHSPALLESEERELREICHVATMICSIGEIEENPEFLLGWDDDTNPFLHGCYDQHPFYCLLAREANPASSTNNFMAFLGQFAVAYWRWQPRTGVRFHLLEEACRAARRLGKNTRRLNVGDTSDPNLKVLPEILAALPSIPCTPTDYLSQFTKQARIAPSLNAKEIELHTLELITRVFENTLPGERTASGRGPTKKTKKKVEGTYSAHRALPGSDQILIVATPPKPPIDDVNEPEDGADRSENSTITYVKVRSKRPVFTTDDDQYLRIANSNRSASLARTNQCLPLAFDSLSAFDIERLCELLDTCAKNAMADDPEAIAYLALQFGSGQPRESVSSAVLTTPSLQFNAAPAGYTKRGVLFFSTWCGHKESPERNTSATAQYTSRLSIQLPKAAVQLASTWINHAALKTGQPLFTSSPNDLIKRADAILKGINDEFGTRLSITRVEGFLYRQLAQMPGSDPSVAIYLTGQPDNCSYSPTTYTAWPLTDLAQFYKNCQVRIGEWAHIGAAWLDGFVLDGAEPDLVTGSRICPTRETIHEFARAARSELQSASNDPPNHLSVVAQHNLYIAGFYAFLEFSLGTRVVTHLLLHPDCLDLETGVLYISDKDNHAYYHGRMVYLPGPVIDAFRQLARHIDALIGRVIHLNPAIAKDLRWDRSPPPNGSRARDINNALSKPRLLFALDPDGTVCPLLPGSAMARWEQRTSLPTNAFRHAFRTYARRKGVTDPVVRAEMAHWSIGQEPIGRFSGMSPRHLKSFSRGWMTDQLRFRDDFRWLGPVSPLLK